MKKALYISRWIVIGLLGIAIQLVVAKRATETEKDPDLKETAQFSREMYPEIAARITPEGLQQHIRVLSSIPSRLTGTEGADRAADYIVEQFKALGVGAPVVEEFPVTVPVHSRAEIRTAGAVYTMHPIYPNGICPAGLPPEGLPTRLVYGGFGRLADVAGKDLTDATVVVETGDRELWLYLIDLGAHAIIFVERQRPMRSLELFTQTGSHQSVPRFWLTASEGAPLVERLRKGDLPATLYSDARWESRRGKNIWVEIPGVSDAPHNADEFVVICAYYDSSSFVPDLAPGAEQACGIAALLELAKIIRDHPFEKRVRLLALSGHFQALEGARRYVWEHVGRHDAPMRDVSPIDHAAFFTLDLSSNSRRMGLFYGGHFFQQLANNLKPRLSDLGRRASEYAGEIAAALEMSPDTVFVDTINPTAGKEWTNYLPTLMALDHEAALLAGIPALAFVTTNDTRIYAGTPNDTDVNIDSLTTQTRLLACLLPNAFNVEGRYLKRSLPRSMCRIKGRAVSFDPREGYLPSKPVAGGVVTSRRQGDVVPFFTGVYVRLVTTVDENGEFEYVGMGSKAEVPYHMCIMSFEPYMTEDGRITWAPDFGQMGRESYPITLLPVQKHMELMCVAFECKPLEIYSLFDPRNYNYLVSLQLLEAGSNSTPPIYGTTMVQPAWPSYFAPTVSLFVPPETRLKVTASAGPLRKRMVFLNVPEERPEDQRFNTGDGFAVDDMSSIRLAYYQSAHDMWRLNESRIQFFGEHGIQNDRVNELHGMAANALAEAEGYLEDRDYVNFYGAARRALSLESWAYPDVVGMANDTVRGLIFYLALLLPFAFVMERLFLAGRRIETRILGITAFFIVMFFILRFSHPGFLIVLSPMVVLLGFVVAVLSLTVILIVMGKLEYLVSKRKTAQQGEHETGVHRVSGFAVALEMGIANMRRRRARTVLTSITLIILTFSVLSFVSVRSQVRLQRYVYKEGATPYSGILLRTMRWEPLPFETYASLRNELEDIALVAPRRWYYGALVLNQTAIDMQFGDTIRSLKAVLGLTAQEQQFVDVQSGLLGDSRWLSPETPGQEPTAEILLPLNLAIDFLGLSEREASDSSSAALSPSDKAGIANAMLGKKVKLLGREFDVVGVFDWERMNEVVDLDGEGLTPYDPLQMEKKNQEEGVPDPEEIQRYIHHSFKDVAILPEHVLGSLAGELRSVAIRPYNPADVEPLAKNLVRQMDYILFANIDGVPTLLSSRSATSIAEYWNLAILMLIAALIVFNTMLGSVYERTKEIGTYTALGIAPSHIAWLFLVEAAVFSIIGVMAGYVLGQSVSRTVHVLDITALGALNLNYSSLAAVGACLVVMAIVMLSAAYPARKASEIGVPDIDRRWKLPKTKEAVIILDLPFTVSPGEAQGLVAFLKEYLDSHVDVSVGSFYVEDIEAGPKVSGNGGTGVKGRFWLTPFDLGVSQYTTFALRKIRGLDVLGVCVRIDRLSGDAGSWRRANGHFMTDMRSQFLIWRNLSPAVRAEYIERGREFAPA